MWVGPFDGLGSWAAEKGESELKEMSIGAGEMPQQ